MAEFCTVELVLTPTQTGILTDWLLFLTGRSNPSCQASADTVPAPQSGNRAAT